MGWFDNEQGGEKPAAAPSQPPPRAVTTPPARVPSPAPPPATGSTLGPEIQIDGTIKCGEDLTILGKVEGTIHAKGTLVVAKEARVHATIDGHRVLVHGRVDGNVQGTERVVLGQTARLVGNIEAPTLEIIEGARFKGSVEMQTAPAVESPAKDRGEGGTEAASKTPAPDKPAPARSASESTEKTGAGKAAADKAVADKAPAGKAAAGKPAPASDSSSAKPGGDGGRSAKVPGPGRPMDAAAASAGGGGTDSGAKKQATS